MLYVQQAGSGPDVVLVHGWGLHAGIWENVAAHLMSQYRITLVDLPGHGRSQLMPGDELTLDNMVDSLIEAVPKDATWIGWSLGGLLSMRAALRHPEYVRALAIIASSPRFTSSADWPNAMAPDVLTDFADRLLQDWEATLQGFLFLQMFGTADARQHVRQLREHLLEYGAPDVAALHGGLEILQSTDLRDELTELSCPSLFLYGERDRLVPPGVAADIQTLLPAANTCVIEDAGHVPFVSHFDTTLEQLRHFLVLAESHAGETTS
jgi:pimeloyl-[acyl-carrier protein] methyl ester esterase